MRKKVFGAPSKFAKKTDTQWVGIKFGRLGDVLVSTCWEVQLFQLLSTVLGKKKKKHMIKESRRF